MSSVGGETRSEGPAIEQVVSARAWQLFPGLEAAVAEWAGLAGAEASDLIVSAVPVGMDWISVRVSRVEGSYDRPVDWLEWLMPMGFKGACQSAIDHFAASSLDGAARSLSGRDGALKGVADFPPVPAPTSDVRRDGMNMPKKAPEPAARKSPAKTPTATAGAARSRKPADPPPPPAKASRAAAPAAAPTSARSKAPAKAPAKPAPTPAKTGGKSKGR
jgi:hypothetical protein